MGVPMPGYRATGSPVSTEGTSDAGLEAAAAEITTCVEAGFNAGALFALAEFVSGAGATGVCAVAAGYGV